MVRACAPESRPGCPGFFCVFFYFAVHPLLLLRVCPLLKRKLPREGSVVVAEKLLHIYSQEYWHDDAFLVATRDGLLALRAAIDRALKKGTGSSRFFTGDGEGYSAHVVLLREEKQETWRMLRWPYTDEVAQDRRQGTIHPSDLI